MTSLYCILARAAPKAVIFRRGPSKYVRLIAWNLRKDTFELGQWFKGRIYAQKSDLSPNGARLVYFAAKYRRPVGTWIAVSTPPYLTAHVLWPAMGTWNDISLFDTDDVLALATYRADSSLEPLEGSAIPRTLEVRAKPWPGYFHMVPEHARLIRDGWSIRIGDQIYHGRSQSEPLVYTKPVGGADRETALELTVDHHQSRSYALQHRSHPAQPMQADWADVHEGDVLLSRGGRLLRLKAPTNARRADVALAAELADFSDMTFESIEAPDWAKRW